MNDIFGEDHVDESGDDSNQTDSDYNEEDDNMDQTPDADVEPTEETVEDATAPVDAPPQARAAGQPVEQRVILGYIPPGGVNYAQPRNPPARTQWDGALNAFVRTDPTDLRHNGPAMPGYVWVNELPGWRRTEQQTINDERNRTNPRRIVIK